MNISGSLTQVLLIEDNSQMAAIFEADDRLAAAMAEIKRLKAEVVSLKEQLAGAIGTRNEAIRAANGYKARAEKLEKIIKATGAVA